MSFHELFLPQTIIIGIPQDLFESGAHRTVAGFFRIFWRVILPLSPPILNRGP